MKIALIALHFAEYASRLALSLQREHEVHLFMSQRNVERELTPDVRAALKSLNLTLLHHPRRSIQPFQAANLAAKLAVLRPDVVHVQEALSSSPAWALQAMPRAWPVVLTVHDPTPHPGQHALSASSFKSATRLLRNRADCIIVHGDTLAKQWRERDIDTGPRVIAIPHGVLGGMSLQSEEPSQPTTFLFFGRIEAYKGLDILTGATERLSAYGYEFKVVIAGSGSDLALYRHRLLKLKQVELIDRYIPPEEIPDLFRRSTATILPYKEASQSGVAAMSFAAGRPVISSNVGALPDVVTHNRNGLLIEPNDPDALFRAMKAFLESRQLYQDLRIGALETASGPLNWDKIAELTTSVYRRLQST